MNELDFLLEELALNSAFAETVPVNSGHTSSHGESAEDGVYMESASALAKGGNSSSVYSDLPSPVVAALSLDSASKELDSIMQDLLSLDIGDPTPPSSIPPPLTQKKSMKGKPLSSLQENKEGASAAGSDRTVSKSNQIDAIDDLLGGLSSDLEKIGVCTVAKGHCASCGKCIVGKIITALGEVWHPEHFVCVSCNTELGTQGFFERDGRPYCNKDYHRLFSPRCGYCKGPIMQKILTALDQSWHPEHFFCTHCGSLFGSEGFLEKDGKPYCNRDFYLLFAPKCSGCGEPVKENYLTAANGTWHPECFVCSDCLKPITGGRFMELEGRTLCVLHFHSRQGMLCGGCNEPITGRCISALDRKFHPEHFTCNFCLRPLSNGVFKEHLGKAYCSPCYSKLVV